MIKPYHIEICKRALGKTFSPRALDTIITANIRQDRVRYQFNHPHFHFDSNAFEASDNYIKEQRQIVLDINKSMRKLQSAWQAFGKITHVVQDFYAHSNYIQLWINAFHNVDSPTPQQVNALDTNTLHHPELHSGNVYFWDLLAFIPGFYSLARYLTPENSHTHMNLDHPGRGPLFPYAIEAAVKRTDFEYVKISDMIGSTKLALFRDI